MPAEPDRQLRALGRCRVRLGDGLRRDVRRIDAVAAGGHVRKVEAQRRDAAALERVRDRLHARVPHAGARAVREHERGDGVVRALPQHAKRTVHSYGSSVTLGSQSQCWRSTTGRVNVAASVTVIS